MTEIPKVLLIGGGKFGRNYIPILKAWHESEEIIFLGVCVTTAERAAVIAEEFSIPAFSEYSSHVSNADVVFVVTPPETHVSIVSECLEHTDVFVEKPLAYTATEVEQLDVLAKKSNHHLMVGQLFRFHPVTTLLAKQVQELSGVTSLVKIEGVFVNPTSTDVDRPVSFEMIHWYDLIYFLFPEAESQSVNARAFGNARRQQISIRYPGVADAEFVLGWSGEDRERHFTLVYADGRKIVADYLANEVRVTINGETVIHDVVAGNVLQDEATIFMDVVRGVADNPVPPKSVLQTISIAEQVELQIKQKTTVSRPRVAVIGAGIFGTNLAYDIADSSDVTLFEQRDDIMREGAMVNQFRHHMGYHYPRSGETVLDIQHSNQMFEERFREALVTTTPTYYGIAKEGSHVTPEQFLAFCDEYSLPYTIEAPPKGNMDEDLLALTIRVPEPSYHYERLKQTVENLLREKQTAITLRLSTKITNCVLLSDGTKLLSIQHSDGSITTEVFDFVVNATYAHMNDFAVWLDVPRHPVRIDLTEVLIITFPTPLVSLTVMDGPFATIMPTGNPGECTLYHAEASILDRYTPVDGLVKPDVIPISRATELFERSRVLFPILDTATIVESRIVHRGVLAYHEHDDARVADVVQHGFGCWSVLSGKIVSSVRTSKRIAEMIAQTKF